MYFLKLFNDNYYIKLCNYLTKRLIEVRNLIFTIRESGQYKRVSELDLLYRQIFSYANTKGAIEISIERVLHPYTIDRSITDLKPDNSTLFISLKLLKKDLVQLDILYGKQLTSLLRFYKSLFSIINSPNKNISNERILKYEQLIDDIAQRMNIYLSSIENKELIAKREKLTQQVIKNLPHNGFYHMTHSHNVESILSNGLFCHNSVKSKNILNFDISNPQFQNYRNRLEKVFNRNIQDYVPLYINPSNPMMSSRKVIPEIDNMVILEIFPHILIQKKETLFSDGNAATLETNFYNDLNKLEKVNWKLLQLGEWTIGGESQRIMCSEVLVPELIEVFYINKILLKNENNLDNVVRCFPNHYGIHIEIDPKIYKIKMTKANEPN